MKVGDARVCTRKQNLERQFAAFKKAAVQKVFAEKLSGKNTERPALKALLHYIHDQEEVVVLGLDCLGRNSHDLTEIIETIKHRGAVLNVLHLPSFAGVQDKNLKGLLTNLSH